MPLNLGVFGSEKATDVIEAFPEIELKSHFWGASRKEQPLFPILGN